MDATYICNLNNFLVGCIKSNLHFPMEHILAENLNKMDMAIWVNSNIKCHKSFFVVIHSLVKS